MIISQAAIVNLKNVNPSMQGVDKTYAGNVIDISKGVLTVQVGADTYNLELDQQNNIKIGDAITFLLTDNGSKAEILLDSATLPSDNILLKISPELTELLNVIDSVLKEFKDDSSDLKQSLLNLLSSIKNDTDVLKNVKDVLSNIKDLLQNNKAALPENVKISLINLAAKLDSVSKNSIIDINASTNIRSVNNFNEQLITVKGESLEKLLFFKDKENFIRFINKFDVPEAIKTFPQSKDKTEVLVYVEPKSSKELSLQIFKGQGTESGLKHVLHKQLSSNLLKTQLFEPLIAAIQKNEDINIKSLKILDSIFQNISLKQSMDLSKEKLVIVFSQLLNTLGTLENDKVAVVKKLAPLLLNSITNDLKDIMPQIEDGAKRSIEDVFNSINNSFDKGGKEFFESLFKLVGLNNESSLNPEINPNPNIDKLSSDSIKTILMQIFNSVNNDEKNSQNVKEPVQNTAFEKGVLNPVMQDKAENQEKVKSNLLFQEKIEQVVNKIEALQILAKKVPANNVDSQLITVPVNINNELTELRLQFKREKTKKNNRENQFTSVLLNIELSMIGEVSAEMKFLKNRDLSINLLLSNKPTIEWFEKNKVLMIEALMKYDFNSVALNLNAFSENNEDQSQIHSGGNSRFDVTI